MVAFFTRRLGCFTIAILLPCQHRLADMDTTVVDDIGFDYLISVRHDDIGQCITQQVIAHMAQMKRFIGIG